MAKKINLKILIGALITFFISFFLRIYRINVIPANINPDACDAIWTYLRFKHRSDFYLFDLNWNGAPALNTYIIGLAWELYYRTVTGLRLPMVILSSLTVSFAFIYFYLLTKKIWLSFIVSLLLATNPLFLNFSRDGWENIFNSLYLTLILIGYYLFSNKKYLHQAISLIIIGVILGFYGYHPGKFYLLAVLISMLIIKLPQNISRLKLFLITMIIVVIFIGPQLIFMVTQSLKSFGRIYAVSIFQSSEWLSILIKNIINNIRGFIFFDIDVFQGYLNQRYLPLTTSFINIVLLPFYLIGLGYALIKIPEIIIIFIIILFPVQIFSLGSPDGARAVHSLPLFFTFIILGINFFINLIQQKNLSRLIYIIITVCFSFLIWFNIKTYFNWITNERTLKARRPAIKNEDIFLWSSSLESVIKKGGFGFNVGEWEKMIKK